MPIYRIADLDILINPLKSETKKRLIPYLSASASYDFEVSVSQEDFVRRVPEADGVTSCYLSEDTVIFSKICEKILADYDGFFFHSSSLMLEGEGYVFTALSGTGKSTHTALWRELFGDKVTMINDDKPIIRRKDGVFYVYGTPWMGKAEIGNNAKAPVKAVYILQRGEKNSAVRVKTGEYFKQILEATAVPADKSGMAKLLELLDGFFTAVPLYLLTCNTDVEAAMIAFEAAEI